MEGAELLVMLEGSMVVVVVLDSKMMSTWLETEIRSCDHFIYRSLEDGLSINRKAPRGTVRPSKVYLAAFGRSCIRCLVSKSLVKLHYHVVHFRGSSIHKSHC